VFVCILPEKAIPEMTHTVSVWTHSLTQQFISVSWFCQGLESGQYQPLRFGWRSSSERRCGR